MHFPRIQRTPESLLFGLILEKWLPELLYKAEAGNFAKNPVILVAGPEAGPAPKPTGLVGDHKMQRENS